MSGPTVAVVIPCFDLGHTLREAVASVRGQTRDDLELVIVDDGSTDPATRDELDRLTAEGEAVVRTTNRGVGAARNLGARLTSAPLLVFLDADDRLAPRYLEVTVGQLELAPELAFVSTAQRGFEAASYVWCPPAPHLPDSIARGVVHVSSLLRREVWAAVGGWDESLEAYEELDFWTRVMAAGFPGTVIEEPLLEYRVRPDSMWHSAVGADTHLRHLAAYYARHREALEPWAIDLLLAKIGFVNEQHRHRHHLARLEEEASAEIATLERRLGGTTEPGEPRSASTETRPVPTTRPSSAAPVARAVVLAYHRVAADPLDPHRLCVAPGLFESHLELLRAAYRPTRLADLAEGLRRGEIPGRAVAVTFDDGYLDNLEEAAPRLEALDVPATFFVTSLGLDRPHEPWWDLLVRTLLSPDEVPVATLELELPSGPRTFDLSSEQSRRIAHDELWDLLFPLDRAACDGVTEALRELLAPPPSPPDRRLLTGAEVADLASRPGLDVGAHSSNHLRLTVHTTSVRAAEIRANRRRLEEITGRPVALFAYPFGELDEVLEAEVAGQGFTAAVTIAPGLVTSETPPHRIPRLEVPSDTTALDLHRRLEELFGA